MRMLIKSHLCGEPGNPSTQDALRVQGLHDAFVPGTKESEGQVRAPDF